MSYSQSNQDLFPITCLKNKTNGSFVEIGSNHPITHNNTYLLESKYQWKGLMVEYDSSFLPLYNQYRKKSIYEINDARKVDYYEILTKNRFPNNIDYLQIDLDVNNRSTLDTLEIFDKTVFDNYTFATITFEHDIYSGNYFDTQEISRKIFQKRGYELLFPNVKVFWEGKYQPFEDWYVHPKLVDTQIIDKLKTNESLNSDQIKNILQSIHF
jgi:disulfide oxidoreductase YuzD